MSASRILERLGELPSPPFVYLRLNEALSDPNTSHQALAQLIEQDPSLTARLLRLANSALYGFPTKVRTVTRALSIIGIRETRVLILATAVISVFRDIPLGAVSMRSFWEHGIACGIAARAIARRAGHSGEEVYYLAGLLHDIGRLPLFILEASRMSDALLAHREQRGHLWEIELDLLGVTHAEVGSALLTHWGIPDIYGSAAALHHGVSDPMDWTAEAAVTHLADLIVNGLRIGTSGTRWVPPLDDLAWRTTGLEITDLPHIVETTISSVSDVIAAFLEP